MSDAAPLDDPAALTRYIEERYHARHRAELPEIAALAARVEQVHEGAPGVPRGLAGLLRKLIGELEVHMKKEELILFPAIRRGGGPGIENPIAAMRADHDDHGVEMACIEAMTNRLTAPGDACGSWRTLYARLGSFVADLSEHIRLENEILFPPFETAVSQGDDNTRV
ncbi:MAG TPA: hemerythrin domain-containing protein [Rhodoblastus sp.]|nr:hemerythrin domain-containing protein [Rhodoblastus sp.]